VASWLGRPRPSTLCVPDRCNDLLGDGCAGLILFIVCNAWISNEVAEKLLEVFALAEVGRVVLEEYERLDLAVNEFVNYKHVDV
jgi:hypothetical protein